MPHVHLGSAVQPPNRRGERLASRPLARRRAARPRVAQAGKHLAILNLPSPSIGNTCTTHNQMLFWIGWFERFHIDGLPYVPYEIKTLDCPVVHSDGSPVLRGDGQPQMMRCIREIARSEVKGIVEWHMISWNVGQTGATFQRCASLDDAVNAFNAPPSLVRLP